MNFFPFLNFITKVRPFWLAFGIVTIPFFMCRHANLAISEYGIQMSILILLGVVEIFKQIQNKVIIRPALICILSLIGVLFLHLVALGNSSNFGFVISYGIYFFVCLISIYLHINENEIIYLAYCYVISSTIIAVLMFFSPYVIFGRITYKFSNNPAFEPNFLGFYFSVAVIIALYKLIYFKGNKYNNYLIIGMIILNVVASMATGSRNAVLGEIIAISYFCFFINKANVKGIVLIALLIFIASISLVNFIPDEVFYRLFHSDVLDESNTDRINRWRCALQTIQLRPVLGYGVITSLEAISSATGVFHIAAHNSFLSLWINFGIFGVLGVLGCYYDIVKNSLKNGQYFCIFAVTSLIFMEMVVEFDITYSFWYGIIFFLKGAFISKRDCTQSVF